MPESVDQILLPPPEASPVSRIITRIKDAVHHHTPEGRREEYRKKWSHVLEDAKGLSRFELERRLTEEANKYARDRVIRDVLVVTALTGGAVAGVLGINELRKKDWNLSKLFTDLGASIGKRAENVIINATKATTTVAMKGATRAMEANPDLVSNLAQRVADEGLKGAINAVDANREELSNLAANVTTDALRRADTALATDPTLIGNIVTRGAEQASSALREAAASETVQNNLANAGTYAAKALVDGATAEMKARASALPYQAEAVKQTVFAKFLSFFTPKK